MNIPNLPTDNIYKFAAIFGLIISLGSVVLRRSTDRLILEAKVRSEISHTKKNTDSSNSVFMEKMYHENRDFLKKRMELNPEKFKDYNYFYQEDMRLVKEFEEHKEAYKNSINESFRNDMDLEYYKGQKESDIYVADILKYLGALLISWGFLWWYWKHQIYIDAEIRWKGNTYREMLKDKDFKKFSEVKTKIKDDVPNDEESGT